MNCIIISDKANSISIEEFIRKSTSLHLEGTFSDSSSVSKLLSERADIDLVFLDLDTPGINSFDFISSLNYQPNIIMLSSGDQNALRAFDMNVVDYLLKPVTYSRFCKALDKANRYYSHKDPGNSGDNDIFIKRGSALVRLKFKDIIFIEALENYVTLNTTNEKFTIHFTMKGIESQLPSGLFIRIHRSFIVNKKLINAIKEDSMDLIIGGTVKNLPVGKSFRQLLMNDINLISR